MKPFDYLTVLISIIMGLAIANLLSGAVRLMHGRHRLRIYWPSLVWAVWLFVVTIQHWWSEFGLRNLAAQDWTFGGFMGTLLVPVDLYLLCALVLPYRDDDTEINLQSWYFQSRRTFFILCFLLAPLSYIEQLLTSGTMHKSPLETALLGLLALAMLVGLALRNRRVHGLLAIFISLLTIVYIGLLFTRLPG